MNDPKGQLLAILRIGHETSMSGKGISMHDALVRTSYKEHRPRFCSSDLIPIIKATPELAEEWLAYSEDKRTSGGWYLLPKGEIGQVGFIEAQHHFLSLAEAVAEYVVRELDFWVGQKA